MAMLAGVVFVVATSLGTGVLMHVSILPTGVNQGVVLYFRWRQSIA
jgi:hypothetical protein